MVCTSTPPACHPVVTGATHPESSHLTRHGSVMVSTHPHIRFALMSALHSKRLAYLTTMYVKANLRVLHLICTFSIQRLVLEDLLDAHDVDDLTSAASTLSHQIKTMSRIYKEQRAYFDQMLTTFDDAGERAAFKFSLCRRQREQRSVVAYDVHVCVCARVGACIIYAQSVCVCWCC